MSEATATAPPTAPPPAPPRAAQVEDPPLRTVVRWLLGITRPVHGPLLISLGCRIVQLGLDLALFYVAAAGVVTLLAGGTGVGALTITLVVLSLAKAGMFYLEQFTGHYVAFKALELLRAHVFSVMWPKAPSIVTSSRSGDVLTSLTRDVDRIEVVYAHTFAPVVSAYVVGAGATVVAAVTVGWAPVAVAAACLAVSLLIVPYLGIGSSMRATRRTLAHRRQLGHHVTDTVFGLDEVLGYGMEADRKTQTDRLGAQVAGSARAPRRWAGIRRGANAMLAVLAVISVLWFGRDVLTAPVLAGLAAAALRVFEGPRGIEDATGYLDHSLAAARRLWHIGHAPAGVEDGPDELALSAAPAIQFTGVDYTYPAGASDARAAALTGVHLSVPAGGRLVLVGRSGSGKSTLVQLLQRYDDPTGGAITIDGEPVGRYTLDSLRRHIVSVAQRGELLDASVAENLRLGARSASDHDLWRALAVARFDDEVRAMPEGLDTPVGRGGAALSGGQAQRLCLARALLMRPKVLILDEFTSSLDEEREAQVRAALAEWDEDMTIIEVTHRLRAVDGADAVAVLDRGRVIASGGPESLSVHRIEEYFRAAAPV